MTDVGLKTSGRFTRTERVRSQGAECVRGGVGADEKLREMKCFQKTYLDYLCKISIGKKVLAREVKFSFRRRLCENSSTTLASHKQTLQNGTQHFL